MSEPEYIKTFKLHVFHSVEACRYEIEIPEIERFRGPTLAVALANAMQAIVYTLSERPVEQMHMVSPARPT